MSDSRRVDWCHPLILAFSALMAGLTQISTLHFGPFYYEIFTADALYIPDLFEDLIGHRETLANWRFSPAPNFFPDMLIYGLALLRGGGFRTAVILSGFLQTVLFLEASLALSTVMRLRRRGVLVGVAAALLASCYAQYFWRAGAFPPTNDIFWLVPLVMLGDHFGAVVSALWGLGLVGYALLGDKPGFLGSSVLLFLLVLATGCSDPLFVIWFCAPALLCLMGCVVMTRELRGRAGSVALLLAVSSLSVYYLQRRYNPLLNGYRSEWIEWLPQVSKSLGFVRTYLFGSGTENAFHAAIVLLSWATLVVFVVARLIRYRKNRSALTCVRGLIIGFLILSPLVCAAFGCFSGLFHDDGMPRYSLPILFMTLVGWSLIIAAFADEGEGPKVPIRCGRTALACTMPLLVVVWFTRAYPVELTPPPQLGCLPDERLEGLAEYWQARPTTLFSKHRLQVVPLTLGAVPMWWISNRFWFTHSRANPRRRPLFSFIDMRRLDSTTVEDLYGKPSRVVSCSTGDIWFYDDADQLTRRFLEVYAHSAAALDP